MGGGSKTTSVTIPKWLEDAAQENIASAKNVSKIGYTPYYGPDVAAMTPAQIAAMQGTNQMASAFGMPTYDATAGMPAAKYYNGMPAYSSGGLYDQALAELKARRPGQYNAIMDMFIDPFTGKLSSSIVGSPSAVGAVGGGGGGGGGGTSQNTGKTYGGEGADRYSYSSMQNGSAAPRSGTGSFGLPDPMSGQITSIGNIGRPGSLVNNIADAVSNLFAGATASSSNNNRGGNSGGSSSGSSGGSSGQRSESRR